MPIASLLLRPGSRRDFESLPGLALGPDTALVQLTLVLKADQYPAYRVSLQTADGRDLWIREGLPVATNALGKSLVLDVPADALAPGHYVVTVRGSGPPVSEPIADYVFRIVPSS